MKKTLLPLVLLCCIASLLHAQVRRSSSGRITPSASPIVTAKKYPSLLWEITGNGMKKPSYLFGTMHVSNKLAFHLGDSFYHAIRSADVVALETNPETWQEDYSTSTFYAARNGRMNMFDRDGQGNADWYDRMRITSFAIDQYEEPVKAALAVEPSMINGMLYRSSGSGSDDFEEDTFLDMYIFQVGKKLGKRLSGVENFQASEKLVMEAYRDMMLDQNRKRRSYDLEGRSNPKRIEEAYRRGDLDLLDSLEALSVESDAFQEKFLFKRNEIQANSIDSIIKKHTLFVGVGAAHLPGRRGVIEMLRAMGYKLRPVSMDDRNSVQKETIDKMRLDNSFVQQSAADGFYKVSVPGSKLYRFTEILGMDVQQYADLVNGAYYVITRVKTNSTELGHTPEQVYRKIDSLLYENIPGKLVKKTAITKNGYKGFDIVNRPRRGDQQRYQVFVTPFEVIIFKMSGNNEYVTSGTEGDRFFNSIQLKEYGAPQWMSWQPVTGGFSAQVPHEPALLKDQFEQKRLEYHAWDKQDGNSYLVMQVNLHNYSFIEEDTFELNLMDESYAFSAFVKKRQNRKFTLQNGYPAMECKYLHKDGSFSTVRYIIRGSIYYVVMARYKQENANVRRFMESFTVKPFVYPDAQLRTDTALHYTVQSPVFPEKKKEEQGMQEIYNMVYSAMEQENDLSNTSKTMFIGNDTIGEKVLVNYSPLSIYSYWKDSTEFWKSNLYEEWDEDSTYIIRLNKTWRFPGNDLQCREVHYTDTGSSRLMMVKSFYRNGHLFTLSAVTDTISKPGPFLQQFFTTFTPADTLKGASVFTRKSEQFMKDLFSKDSTVTRKASKAMYQVDFDVADVGLLQRAIDSLRWGMRDYLRTKGYFIRSLGDFKDPTIVPYLKKLYMQVKDTADLQESILEALTEQQTKEAFIAFKDLLLEEPPIDYEGGSYSGGSYTLRTTRKVARHSSSGIFSNLYDTLSLAKVIFPDVLQLMTVDDYEGDIMQLLKTMVDSGYLKAKDYESYFSKLYLDGKVALKKQVARQDKEKIEKVERKEQKSTRMMLAMRDEDEEEDEEADNGNEMLDMYAALLLPFRDKNPGVQTLFEQLMKVQDREVIYNTMLLLLRHQQPVPDSLFMKYAKLDKYRAKLYEDLLDLKMVNKFPAQYKTQAEITKSLLITNMSSYNKVDTLAFLDKLPVTYKGKKGYVYFYKYKRMRDDASWQVASVGMQPEKQGEVDVDDFSFFSQSEQKLELDVPVREQLEKLLKEMLYAKHKSATEFYEARAYSQYKGYMSEAVKRGRYRE